MGQSGREGQSISNIVQNISRTGHSIGSNWKIVDRSGQNKISRNEQNVNMKGQDYRQEWAYYKQESAEYKLDEQSAFFFYIWMTLQRSKIHCNAELKIGNDANLPH